MSAKNSPETNVSTNSHVDNEQQRLARNAAEMPSAGSAISSPLRRIAEVNGEILRRVERLATDRCGRVIFADAGPGDARLMSVAAAEALRHAVLVIHDGLSDALLDAYNSSLRRDHTLSRETPALLAAMCAEQVKSGDVVRLTNNVAEVSTEIAACRAAGCECVDMLAALAPAPPAAVDPGRILDVILIRHAEIGDEHQGRYVGSHDVPLGERGRRQAQQLAGVDDLHQSAMLFASPMLRVRETLAAIDPNAAPVWLRDLREIDFGEWENMSYPEVVARDPARAAAWARLDGGFEFPGGDSLESFHRRVARAADEIVRAAHADADCRRVHVYAHGGVIRALICRWLGLPDRAHLLMETSRASISALKLYGSHGVLTRLNDCSHMRS